MSGAVFWLRFSFVCGRGCAGVGVLGGAGVLERVRWRGCALCMSVVVARCA